MLYNCEKKQLDKNFRLRSTKFAQKGIFALKHKNESLTKSNKKTKQKKHVDNQNFLLTSISLVKLVKA